MVCEYLKHYRNLYTGRDNLRSYIDGEIMGSHKKLKRVTGVIVVCFVLYFGVFNIGTFIQPQVTGQPPDNKKAEVVNKQNDTKYKPFTVRYIKIGSGNHTSEQSQITKRTTVISAYFNLGKFHKGNLAYYTTNHYFRWASAFRLITNPMIIYTDDVAFGDYITKLREQNGCNTVVFIVKRNQTWAFSLKDKIKEIYSQRGYPKHQPNTVLPAYSCAMHAKFELVTDAIHRNIFKAKYYQWLDIGLFRALADSNSTQYFSLKVPEEFDDTKIGYSRVYQFNPNTTASQIIRSNSVWVGGATFIGAKDVVLRFCSIYKKTVEYFIGEKLMSTDQQMLYSMYTKEGRKVINPDVEIQTFSTKKSPYNIWFYLGYICRKTVPNVQSRC